MESTQIFLFVTKKLISEFELKKNTKSNLNFKKIHNVVSKCSKIDLSKLSWKKRVNCSKKQICFESNLKKKRNYRIKKRNRKGIYKTSLRSPPFGWALRLGLVEIFKVFFLVFFFLVSLLKSFAQKQMKSGLGKNGGGGNRGFSPPPRTPFVMLNSYPTLPKKCLEKLECICRSHKKYFWPNCLPAKYTSAWKKMLTKWQFLFYPFCYDRKWPKCFKKNLGECCNIIFFQSRLC